MSGYDDNALNRLPQRFWDKVKKTPTCWLWTGKCHPYGRFKFEGKQWDAHRFIWVVLYGALLPKICVLHKCDVQACVRPEHLFLGTKADNIYDMDKKGRRGDVAGIRNGQAKFTEEQVRDIRKRFIPKNNSKQLAQEYNTTRQRIWAIATGKCYADLNRAKTTATRRRQSFSGMQPAP